MQEYYGLRQSSLEYYIIILRGTCHFKHSDRYWHNCTDKREHCPRTCLNDVDMNEPERSHDRRHE